jgi:hypothetical protein
VDVTRLRNARAWLRLLGKPVALEDRHLLEALGEDPGGEQSSHAPADDEGAPPFVCVIVHGKASFPSILAADGNRCMTESVTRESRSPPRP